MRGKKIEFECVDLKAGFIVTAVGNIFSVAHLYRSYIDKFLVFKDIVSFPNVTENRSIKHNQKFVITWVFFCVCCYLLALNVFKI